MSKLTPQKRVPLACPHPTSPSATLNHTPSAPRDSDRRSNHAAAAPVTAAAAQAAAAYQSSSPSRAGAAMTVPCSGCALPVGQRLGVEPERLQTFGAILYLCGGALQNISESLPALARTTTPTFWLLVQGLQLVDRIMKTKRGFRLSLKVFHQHYQQ